MCHTFPANMSETVGIYRPNDQAKRHRNAQSPHWGRSASNNRLGGNTE
jgi:hypothetical protein